MIEKYLTIGVKEKLEVEIQLLLWKILEEYRLEKEKRTGKKLDYFQSFYISRGEDYLKIIHHEEDPNIGKDYERTYIYPCIEHIEQEKLRKNQRNKRDKGYTGYIFIIENELSRENKPSYTMLLAREY